MRFRWRKKKGTWQILLSITDQSKEALLRKGTDVKRLKDVIDKMMSGRIEVGCIQNNFFPNPSVIVLILMCYIVKTQENLFTVSSESLQQPVFVCW